MCIYISPMIYFSSSSGAPGLPVDVRLRAAEDLPPVEQQHRGHGARLRLEAAEAKGHGGQQPEERKGVVEAETSPKGRSG